VAVVAPSGPVPRDRFAAGEELLEARYDLRLTDRIFDRAGLFAGDDVARLAELELALRDPTVRAVWCARGGQGLLRLVAALPRGLLGDEPKPIVGFSDVTVLHAFAAAEGVVSIHGPVVTQLVELGEGDVTALFELLESPVPPPPLAGETPVVAGSAEGPLLGGNLEVLTRLLGTGHFPPTDGAVLLLEEVGERPYRIDRQLTQLGLAGVLDRLSGVVVGDLIRCGEPSGDGPSAEEVVVERLERLGIPLVLGVPIGHGARNRAVPLGARVRLDGATGVLTFLEAAVS
jgi:muramoyltetrapeptide carboxypeptidase